MLLTLAVSAHYLLTKPLIGFLVYTVGSLVYTVYNLVYTVYKFVLIGLTQCDLPRATCIILILSAICLRTKTLSSALPKSLQKGFSDPLLYVPHQNTLCQAF